MPEEEASSPAFDSSKVQVNRSLLKNMTNIFNQSFEEPHDKNWSPNKMSFLGIDSINKLENEDLGPNESCDELPLFYKKDLEAQYLHIDQKYKKLLLELDERYDKEVEKFQKAIKNFDLYNILAENVDQENLAMINKGRFTYNDDKFSETLIKNLQESESTVDSMIIEVLKKKKCLNSNENHLKIQINENHAHNQKIINEINTTKQSVEQLEEEIMLQEENFQHQLEKIQSDFKIQSDPLLKGSRLCNFKCENVRKENERAEQDLKNLQQLFESLL